MPITIEPDDTLFYHSPDIGDPDCICSRCGRPFDEDETAIRFFPEGGGEYRFHDYCVLPCFGAADPVRLEARA